MSLRVQLLPATPKRHKAPVHREEKVNQHIINRSVLKNHGTTLWLQSGSAQMLCYTQGQVNCDRQKAKQTKANTGTFDQTQNETQKYHEKNKQQELLIIIQK